MKYRRLAHGKFATSKISTNFKCSQCKSGFIIQDYHGWLSIRIEMMSYFMHLEIKVSVEGGD